MGIKLFGLDIAAEIDKAMSSGLPDITLTKNTVGSRTTGSLTGGQTLTPTSYSCKGFVDNYTVDEIDGTNIKKSDHKILIIGDSLPNGIVPEPGDTITAESNIYKIQRDGVERDPAAATYLCHSR